MGAHKKIERRREIERRRRRRKKRLKQREKERLAKKSESVKEKEQITYTIVPYCADHTVIAFDYSEGPAVPP